MAGAKVIKINPETLRGKRADVAGYDVVFIIYDINCFMLLIPNSKCGVCSKISDLNLLSSGIAPVTIAVCSECEARGAENLDVVLVWLFIGGGVDYAPDFSQRLISWSEGKYIEWAEIAEQFVENEAEIKEFCFAEFLLGDTVWER